MGQILTGWEGQKMNAYPRNKIIQIKCWSLQSYGWGKYCIIHHYITVKHFGVHLGPTLSPHLSASELFSSSSSQHYQIELSPLVKTSFQRELDSISIRLRCQFRKRKAKGVTPSWSTRGLARGSLVSLQICQLLWSGVCFPLKYFSTIYTGLY